MGKFSDKFLNAFNLDEDDEYDEYDDELEDDYEEESSGLFKRNKKQPEQIEEKPVSKALPKKSTPISRNANSQEVCVIKPTSIDDSREISETLLSGKAVIINFEGLHVEISQRVMDFVSGTCYAIDGNLQKISNYIFIATPNFVDISGDFQDFFTDSNSSFDISGFKSPLL